MFYLPDHDSLSSAFTLRELLTCFAQRFGERAVADAARLARVEHLLERRPSTPSGGELRRAELATAGASWAP